MSNLALKYRPIRFEDVVGQQSVVKVLTNILNKALDGSFQLPAGMLFSGSKGTGKTTSARIAAMKLNCETPNQSPCGICSICREIIDSRSTSVIEIDAASHGLVEDIRQLREMAGYAHPGRYRIFIIDECHSMSNSAFNALLKLLEEPPPNTLFILATTEPDKVLDTVRSRLMSFEFKRISLDYMVSRLNMIAEKEGIKIEPAVVDCVTLYANGGMRDAIVMLEQLSFYSEEGVSLADFKELYGVVEVAVFDSLVQSILDGQYEKGMEIITSYFRKASEGKLFLEGLARYFKDMLLAKSGVKTNVNQRHVSALSEKQILDALNVVWELLVKSSYVGSYHSLMSEIGFVQLVRVFSASSSVGVSSVKQPQVKSVGSIVRQMSGSASL